MVRGFYGSSAYPVSRMTIAIRINPIAMAALKVPVMLEKIILRVVFWVN